MVYDDIIEYFSLGKLGKEKDSEDVIVTSPNFYCVIDGVTSKFPITYEDKSSGRYCAELLARAVTTLDKDVDGTSALEILDSAIKKAYGGKEITQENKMQACVIIYSKSKRQIWSYGDCALMINGVSFDHTKRIDKLMEDLRAFAISAYLKEGGDENALYDCDVGRESILPFLKKQALFANTDHYFGYGVIDGCGINKNHIKIYEVKEGDRVVLASDGYPQLFGTLEKSEEYLQYVLEKDPLSINENKQTKMKKSEQLSFDDRSYLSFIVK